MRYKDTKKNSKGRYRYLVECPTCHEDRWISDLRSAEKNCFNCKNKARILNYCNVWPCKCKYCNEPMMLKTKPKTIGSATCQKCKGIHSFDNYTKKEKPMKDEHKIKCSECSNMFVPRNATIKACGKGCSNTRRKRIQREKSLLKIFKPKQKAYKPFTEDRIVKKDSGKPLGGVDEKEKPIYIREREIFNFKERRNADGLTDDELSEALIKKFEKAGGKPSVSFKDQTELSYENGQTHHARGGQGYGT